MAQERRGTLGVVKSSSSAGTFFHFLFSVSVQQVQFENGKLTNRRVWGVL